MSAGPRESDRARQFESRISEVRPARKQAALDDQAERQSPFDVIAGALAANRDDDALLILQRIFTRPLALERNFDLLAEIFREAGKTSILIDALLAPRSPTFMHLSLIAKTGRLARNAGRFTDFEARAEEIASAAAAVYFRQSDYDKRLTEMAGADPDLLRLLRTVKFACFANTTPPHPLFANARSLAKNIEVNPRVLDFLFTHRRATTQSRADWEKQIRTAFAVHHILVDTELSADDQYRMIDRPAAREALRQIENAPGAMVLLFHAGFSSVRTVFLERAIKDSAIVGGYLTNSDGASIPLEPRAALFRGLKALTQNRSVFISPDGQQGSLDVTISVLGRPVCIGGGAAFLAYESKCPTLFFSMNRSVNRFVPNVVPGPSRTGAESFAEFKARLFGFYERMLNDFFTGDPQNFMLTPRWLKVFGDPENGDFASELNSQRNADDERIRRVPPGPHRGNVNGQGSRPPAATPRNPEPRAPAVEPDEPGIGAMLQRLFRKQLPSAVRPVYNLQMLSLALQQNDTDKVTAILEEFCASSDVLDNYFHSIQKRSSNAGQIDLFIDFLLSPRSPAFSQLALASRVGLLTRKARRFRDFKAKIDELATSRTSQVRFGQYDLGRSLLKRTGGDQKLARLLCDLKFAGIADAERPDRLFANARVLAPQIELDPRGIDHLFAHSRARPDSRAAWEDEIRTAYATQHLLVDSHFSPAAQLALIDPDAREEALRRMNSPRGALVLVCHAGFSAVRINFIDREVENCVYMASSDKDPKRIPVHLDSRSALFAGLKALMQKKVLLLAPDGKQGALNARITVLGREFLIGDGAAFLAYESRCDTLWYSMHRTEDRFVPYVVPGPVREGRESFPEYRTRLIAFYEKMLNDFFSGDPRNLVLTPRWLTTFTKHGP